MDDRLRELPRGNSKGGLWKQAVDSDPRLLHELLSNLGICSPLCTYRCHTLCNKMISSGANEMG